MVDESDELANLARKLIEDAYHCRILRLLKAGSTPPKGTPSDPFMCELTIAEFLGPRYSFLLSSSACTSRTGRIISLPHSFPTFQQTSVQHLKEGICCQIEAPFLNTFNLIQPNGILIGQKQTLFVTKSSVIIWTRNRRSSHLKTIEK